MKHFDDGSRAAISYPVRWTYTVIGVDRSALDTAIAGAVEERSHKVSLSNLSSRGRYVSLKLELMVLSEADRLHIFDALKNHAAVALVL